MLVNPVTETNNSLKADKCITVIPQLIKAVKIKNAHNIGIAVMYVSFQTVITRMHMREQGVM